MRYNGKYNLDLDISVLENYHVAEASKLMAKIGLLDNFQKEELRLIRRRMIDGILATDMATHAKHVNTVRAKTEMFQVKDGINIDKLQHDDVSKLYENQQLILSFCLHTSDISNPAKSFVVYKKWVKLVFDEFFIQGDKEREEGLPITILCDRYSTSIPKAQIGFINFVVMPSFELLLNYLPDIFHYINNIKMNLQLYEIIYNTEEKEKAKDKLIVKDKEDKQVEHKVKVKLKESQTKINPKKKQISFKNNKKFSVLDELKKNKK